MKKKVGKKIFPWKYILMLLMIICDIGMVIFCGLKNKVQYVNVFDREVLVGKTRDMLFGKNYVSIVITLFFYIYFILMNKFVFKMKIGWKRFGLLLLLLLFINCMFFYIFTVRVY